MVKIKKIIVFILLFISISIFSQTPKGTTFFYKKVTTAQRDAIDVSNTNQTATIFNLTTDRFEYYNGSQWIATTISLVQSANILTNNGKTGITSTQAANILTNNGKTGITATQASNILTNNGKNTDTGTPAITSNGSAPSLNSGISASEVRSLIGAGTGNGSSNLVIGTTSTTAKAGNITTITSGQASDITTNNGKNTDTGTPAITSNGSIPSLNSGISSSEVRSLIGAGTGNGSSNLVIGTTSTTAKAGNITTITSGQASDITTNNGKVSFTSGSGSYIQNTTSEQTADLNISGTGVFGSSVSATDGLFSGIINANSSDSFGLNVVRDISANSNTSIRFQQLLGDAYVGVNASGDFAFNDTADLTSPKFKVSRSGAAEFASSVTSKDGTLLGVKNSSILTLRSTTNDSNWVNGNRIGGIDFYSGDDSGAGAGVKGSISYEVSDGSTGSTLAMVFKTADSGAGTNNLEALRINSDQSAEFASSVSATDGIFSGDVSLLDNKKATFGTGEDLTIIHNGVFSQINNDSGDLLISNNSTNSQTKITLGIENIEGTDTPINFLVADEQSGNLALYYEGSQRILTTSAGATISGSVTATDGIFSGDVVYSQTVKEITTSTYTMISSDAGKLLLFTNSTGTTVTVNSSSLSSIGQKVDVFNTAQGDVTLSNSGVGLFGNITLSSGEGGAVQKTATTTYIAF
jgi:hypothetical protein